MFMRCSIWNSIHFPGFGKLELNLILDLHLEFVVPFSFFTEALIPPTKYSITLRLNRSENIIFLKKQTRVFVSGFITILIFFPSSQLVFIFHVYFMLQARKIANFQSPFSQDEWCRKVTPATHHRFTQTRSN